MAFKFEVLTVEADFEPEEIKKLNITQADLDSIRLTPITSKNLKELLSKKHQEKKPLIFSLWASHCKPCIREFNIMDSLEIFANENLNFCLLYTSPSPRD